MMLLPAEHGAHCTGAIQRLRQICAVKGKARQGGGRKARSVVCCDVL